jgi:hypothetical protein
MEIIKVNYVKILKELWSETPEIKSVVARSRKYGFIFCGIGIWNFAIGKTIHDNDSVLTAPVWFPTVALISIGTIGILFLLGSYLLSKKIFDGKISLYVGMTGFIAVLVGFPIMFYMNFTKLDHTFKLISTLMLFIVTGQFVIPTLFGYRYLSRLKNENDLSHED